MRQWATRKKCKSVHLRLDNLLISVEKQKLQLTYPEASIKDVQVTKEAFSSQKRTLKHEIS
jgi:hypothetical protein